VRSGAFVVVVFGTVLGLRQREFGDGSIFGVSKE